jgi:hypothetical protein
MREEQLNCPFYLADYFIETPAHFIQDSESVLAAREAEI